MRTPAVSTLSTFGVGLRTSAHAGFLTTSDTSFVRAGRLGALRRCLNAVGNLTASLTVTVDSIPSKHQLS